MSAREVDIPKSLSAREEPVISRTNPIFSVDSPTDTADGAVPEDPAGPQASPLDLRASCRRSASALVSHVTDVGETMAAAPLNLVTKTSHTFVVPFISHLTHICRQSISASIARRLRLPKLLLILGILSYVGLAIRIYASDQTLLDHAALLYATHAPVPLPFSHILPALALPSMFRIKETAVSQTFLAVEYTNCLRLALGDQTCPYPTTGEQSARLKVSLDKLDSSLLPLDNHVRWHLTPELKGFGLPTISHHWGMPLPTLDQAIASTRHQSHVAETLINANELFDVPIYMGRSINARGLEPIETYSSELERAAKDLLPLLERSLSLLLSAHDDYDDLFKTLDEIGLAHYADPLKQILSEGVEEGGEGVSKGQSWGGLKTTFTGRNRTARIPVVLSSTVVPSSLYHCYSIYTLLYSIRYHNILLYKSTVSNIPAKVMNLNVIADRKTFFTSLPFRHPTTKLRKPLGLTKEENDTALSLAREIRARAIPIPPPMRGAGSMHQQHRSA
ncbi:MAG: hypothetical protein Q9197_004947 [Variospora fuerteventurae]